MRGMRVSIVVGLAAVAMASADPVDARTKPCAAATGAVPSALSEAYEVLRTPARRSDALPAGADCRLGKLVTFQGGTRLLAREPGGTRHYFMAVYERRTAAGFEGATACVVTLTPVRRGRRTRFEDVGGCAGTRWFNDGRRTLAPVPDGVARVRLQLPGEPAEREVAVSRNAVVMAGAAPLSWTLLAADGSAVTPRETPFVCEDE